jgi:hypothetical protein
MPAMSSAAATIASPTRKPAASSMSSPGQRRAVDPDAERLLAREQVGPRRRRHQARR